MAVPSVGKDMPSQQSEFSHPDVSIVFTIFCYRLEDMRKPGMKSLFRVLIGDIQMEPMLKFH